MKNHNCSKGLLTASIIFCLSFCSMSSFAVCPSADLNGDCLVDYKDFAIMSSQWMTEGTQDANSLSANLNEEGLVDYKDFAVMAFQWVTEGIQEITWVSINDSGAGMKDWLGDPISHGGFTGEMSKYETTNAQYCQFLNAALASGDITVSGGYVYGANGSNSGADFVGQPYFSTYAADSYSQITYSGGTFSVRSRDGYSMSSHPVGDVSWYGATAFCNYYGWWLPTEWEWQAVADYDGSYTYGCGTSIDFSKANYWNDGYANPLGLTSEPYTSPVGYYPAYGYGMCDMAGNLWEWTSSLWEPGSIYRVVRGGCWSTYGYGCAVSYRGGGIPNYSDYGVGFRACR